MGSKAVPVADLIAVLAESRRNGGRVPQHVLPMFTDREFERVRVSTVCRVPGDVQFGVRITATDTLAYALAP